MSYKIGVDLGGTKISVAVLDSDGRTVFSKRLPTPSHDYAEIILAISQLFEAATHSGDYGVFDSVGVGIPGALENDDISVKNANTQVLIGRSLKTDLETKLGRPVHIANDATCFAASEAADGAGMSYPVVFGVIMGTGVGGGVVVDGRPIIGENRLAGEWGHNPFPFYGGTPKGRPCYCGKIDCIEQILSGPAVSQDYLELTGKEMRAEDIVSAAHSGDSAAAQVLTELSVNLAKALSTVINLLDPNVIVLGGGLSNIDSLYEETPKRWGRYAFNASSKPAAISTRLVANRWGDDSGVRGAAWLT
ncbi:MAG: ROK family protein [Pseudomonadota bacterium]